ncbi:hypothetical protein VTO58DRAFT_108180 [Aureobasidium pullulans]
MTTITHTLPFTPIPVSPSRSNSRPPFPTLPQSQWPLFHLFIVKTRRLDMKPMPRPYSRCPRRPRRYLTPIPPFDPSPPTTTTATPPSYSREIIRFRGAGHMTHSEASTKAIGEILGGREGAGYQGVG